MILHEFAIEPAALSDWNTFKYITEKFGFSQGRLISRFPNGWAREVYEVLLKNLRPPRNIELQERLKKYKSDRIVASRRAFEGDDTWTQKAVSHQSSELPFYRIIAREPDANNSVVGIEEIAEEHFAVCREERIPREPEDIADAVYLLLLCSRQIRFVDPYFDPLKRKWWRVLSEILLRAKRAHCQFTSIEYHFLDDAKGPVNPCDVCKRMGPDYIPNGMAVRFVRWSCEHTLARFHARYILTDVAGVRVDHGLDQGRPGERTDIGMLDEHIHKETWAMYEKTTSPFEQIDVAPIIVQGQA